MIGGLVCHIIKFRLRLRFLISFFLFMSHRRPFLRLPPRRPMSGGPHTDRHISPYSQEVRVREWGVYLYIPGGIFNYGGLNHFSLFLKLNLQS